MREQNVDVDRYRQPDHPVETLWQNLALQGSRMGLVVHGMAGFDYEKARDVLEVPAEFSVEAMIAAGRPAPVEVLPASLREREAPSGRKPVAELAFPGVFGAAS